MEVDSKPRSSIFNQKIFRDTENQKKFFPKVKGGFAFAHSKVSDPSLN